MRASLAVLTLAACTGAATGTPDPADTGSAGGADTGDSAPQPSYAMDAAGTFDGVAFVAQCDAAQLEGRIQDINGIESVALECRSPAERNPYVRLTIGQPAPGTVAECGIASGGAIVNVGFADSADAFYDCAIEDETSFAFTVDSAVQGGDGAWTVAGSFAMAGGNTGHTADVAGSFAATVLPTVD